MYAYYVILLYDFKTITLKYTKGGPILITTEKIA